MPIVVPEPLMQHLMVVLGRRRACMHVLVSSLAEVEPLLLWYVVMYFVVFVWLRYVSNRCSNPYVTIEGTASNS